LEHTRIVFAATAGDTPDRRPHIPRQFEWTPGRLALIFTASEDYPVVLSGLGGAGETPTTAATQPIVEVIATGDGRARTTTRFTNTGVGSRLRYVKHTVRSEQGTELLSIVQADTVTGLRVTTTFSASPQVSAARVATMVTNAGDHPVVLEAVSSFALGALINPGESTRDLVLHSGTGEQLAENRWTARPLWRTSTRPSPISLAAARSKR